MQTVYSLIRLPLTIVPSTLFYAAPIALKPFYACHLPLQHTCVCPLAVMHLVCPSWHILQVLRPLKSFPLHYPIQSYTGAVTVVNLSGRFKGSAEIAIFPFCANLTPVSLHPTKSGVPPIKCYLLKSGAVIFRGQALMSFSKSTQGMHTPTLVIISQFLSVSLVSISHMLFFLPKDILGAQPVLFQE